MSGHVSDTEGVGGKHFLCVDADGRAVEPVLSGRFECAIRSRKFCDTVFPFFVPWCCVDSCTGNDQETRERIFSVDHISCVTGCSAKWGKCIESSPFSITP